MLVWTLLSTSTNWPCVSEGIGIRLAPALVTFRRGEANRSSWATPVTSPYRRGRCSAAAAG